MQLFEDSICIGRSLRGPRSFACRHSRADVLPPRPPVFLALQFVDFAEKISDEDKMVGIVRKTWAKMTDAGRGVVANELVGGLPDDLKVIVGKALA